MSAATHPPSARAGTGTTAAFMIWPVAGNFLHSYVYRSAAVECVLEPVLSYGPCPLIERNSTYSFSPIGMDTKPSVQQSSPRCFEA
jgi:hypothetical protein